MKIDVERIKQEAAESVVENKKYLEVIKQRNDKLKSQISERLNIKDKQRNLDDIFNELIENASEIDFAMMQEPSLQVWRDRFNELNVKGYETFTEIELMEHSDLKAKIESITVSKSNKRVFIVKNMIKELEVQGSGLLFENESLYVYNNVFWERYDMNQFYNFVLDLYSQKTANFHETDRCKEENKTSFYFIVENLCIRKISTNKDIKSSINVKNGTVFIDVEGNIELKEHNREDYFFSVTTYNYDKNATCQRFYSFLSEVLDTEEKQNVLQEFVGYTLTKNLKIEKILTLLGDGANGKSVFIETIAHVLGENNVSNVSINSLCTNLNSRPLISNKLVNFSSEMPRVVEADIIKILASGEPLDAKLLYKDVFTISNYAKIICNANILPRNVEQSEGFFRRFLIVDFNTFIKEENRDYNLIDKLKNESPGILNWILEGTQRVLKQKKLSRCESCEKATEKYKEESDSVRQWLDDMAIKPGSVATSRTVIREHYNEYCQKNGFHAVSSTELQNRMKKNGFKFGQIYETGRKVVYIENSRNEYEKQF